MSQKQIEQIAAELASGYPDSDKARIVGEFQTVMEMVLPPLVERASLALNRDIDNITEVWELIRVDSEKLFAQALGKVERVKVIFTASKFANNKLIGEMLTSQALIIARGRKENQ